MKDHFLREMVIRTKEFRIAYWFTQLQRSAKWHLPISNGQVSHENMGSILLPNVSSLETVEILGGRSISKAVRQ